MASIKIKFALVCNGGIGNANIQFENISVKDISSTVTAAPTVTTASVTTYDSSSATLGGNVTDDGGATVTERGVVYSSSDTTPTIGEIGVTKDTNGTGTGTFSESIGSLAPSTTYYVCAYATNSVGTSYGTMVSFTTLATPAPMLTADTSENNVDNNIDITFASDTAYEAQ